MNKYVVSKCCSKKNEHNRVLGIIFDDLKRSELERDLMKGEDTCDGCSFHSSFIQGDHLPLLPYIIEDKDDNKLFNTNFVKIAVIITFLSMCFVTAAIYFNIPNGLTEKKYLKYLAFGVAYFAVLATIDNKKASNFSKLASTCSALVAMFAFFIELGWFK